MMVTSNTVNALMHYDRQPNGPDTMKRSDRSHHLEVVHLIPEDAVVCHYDQLEDSDKEIFALTATDDTQVIDELPATSSLEQHEYVKFTKYYRVQSHENACSVPS